MKKRIIIMLLLCMLIPTVALAEDNNDKRKMLGITTEQMKEVEAFAAHYQIDVDMVIELLRVETGGTFKHDSIGPQTRYGRAYGMAQFMENTAPQIAKIAGMSYNGKEDLMNPVYAMKLSIVYLHVLQYGGDGYEGFHNWHKTLTAYNRGVAGMKQHMRNTGRSQSYYSTEIMDAYAVQKGK